MSIPRLLRPLRRVHEHIILLTAFALLGVGCLLWSALAFPLNLILPRRRGVWLGRWMATLGFRVYLLALRVIGLARFDLRALDALRDAGPMIIAPNHPGLLDAPMILSRLPNIVCVIKGSLLANPLWGAGSRLARYIPNDWFIGSVNLAVEELQTGSQLLMFPEGTRVERGQKGVYETSGTRLAVQTGAPVIPIAVTSAKCWPRKAFIKTPGIVDISIGKPIPSVGRHHKELMQEVEDWIETEMRRLDPDAY